MPEIFDSPDQHLHEALRMLRDMYDARVAAFESEVASLRQKIQAVEIALSPSRSSNPPSSQEHLPILLDRPSLSSSSEPKLDWSKVLKGLSQPEALKRIAEESQGQLRTAQAKRILIEANLVKGSHKNVNGHIFSLLRDVERFEKLGVRWAKIEPGVYRLLPIDSESEEPKIGELPVSDNRAHWGNPGSQARIGKPTEMRNGVSDTGL